MECYEQGQLQPHVSATYAVSEGAVALRSLSQRRAVGKVVVTVRSGT